jgi:hypothetical protein
MHTRFWLQNLKERRHFDRLGVNGRIILNWILNRQGGTTWTGFIWLRIGTGRSQLPCDLRRGSAAVRLLGSWVRIPPDTCLSVSCECCVLSGRGLCDGPITRTEGSYGVWCVSECDREA